MELISRTEAQTLAEARGVLSEIENRARNHDVVAHNGERLSAKAETAEHAIFDVFNCAQAYCEDAVAKEFVHKVGA